MRTPLLLTTALFAALTVHSANAFAEPAAAQQSAVSDEVRGSLEKGLEHFEAGRYEAALSAFKEGYAIDPRPEFLFAMAQTERLSGDCGSALVFYREFLATKPAQLHADLANGMIDKCQTALSSSAVEPTDDDEALANTTEILVPVLETRTEIIDYQAWHRDPVGVSLLGTGTASLLAGGALMLAARSNSSQAQEAGSYQQHEALLGQAHRQQLYGAVALASGSALVTSAAIYYLFRTRPSHIRELSVTTSDSGASASLRFAF